MIATAFPVGFFAGLFGIGGGLITVPFLFFIFEALGVDKNYLMHLAVGTSFAIIMPTATVSVLTHHKYNAVDFSIVKSYGIFCILGVISGTGMLISLLVTLTIGPALLRYIPKQSKLKSNIDVSLSRVLEVSFKWQKLIYTTIFLGLLSAVILFPQLKFDLPETHANLLLLFLDILFLF